MLNSRMLAMCAICFALLAGLGLSACEGEGEGPSGTSGGGGSTHNAGQDCAQSGCHTNLKYAGTIYTDSTGSSAVANATVVITEADGTSVSMVSDNNGVFYSDAGSPSGGYNVAITGNSLNMVTTAFTGSCSTGGCHDGTSTALISTN